jgi:AAA family ATP:ADP antiporter
LSILDRLLPDFPEDQQAERTRLLGLMLMFFLVVTAVGVLKPVRNAFALAGLGERDFYRVYLVSAVVVLFVPVYNRIADRVGWRALVPGVAVFFGLNLVVFRLLYTEGSTAFGLVFYGWYDLFAAALVTQFFVATQLFLNARSAKSAYPLVIGGGAIGAMLGGGIAGITADWVGTENLLLVGAVLILAFGMGIPWVWPEHELVPLERGGVRRKDRVSAGELRQVFGNHHVRLIAAAVTLTVLTKQLVDYQFNTLTERLYVTQDEITEFQGMVNLATQWLPLLSVVGLRPLLRRWGLGAVVFILPGLVLLSGFGMAVFFSIWTVITVRTADTTFRYSAERAGREILYVPVPDAIKLKAKTYIDVGIEKGLGKVLAAGLLALLVEVLGFGLEELAWVVVLLAAGWTAVTVAIRREYVRTLARSIRGRFASFEGLSALSDASTQAVVRRALRGDDPIQTSFALDLVDQSAGTDTRPIADALHDLLAHASPEIRLKALVILTHDPPSIDPERVRPRLEDPSRRVREQAVLAMVAASPNRHKEVVTGILSSESGEVRQAALAALARDEIDAEGEDLLPTSFLEDRWERAEEGDRDARIELALAAGAMRTHPMAREILEPLLGDPDPAVASAAIRSAGVLGHTELHPAMVAGLKGAATRRAAREALADQGGAAVDTLGRYLLDESAHPAIRRHIPSVLARVEDQSAVTVMLRSVVAPETDQLLDYRTLKALSQLRARAPSLTFDRDLVLESVEREVEAAEGYDRARRCMDRIAADGPAGRLLRRSLDEAWAERREDVFRLLGLLYPADGMYRCHLALLTGEAGQRANAIEWLEETVERPIFEMVAPILGEARRLPKAPAPRASLVPLLADGDPWVARVAVAATAELDEDWSRAALRDIIESGSSRELCDLARRLLTPPEDLPDETPMDLIEKVFLLQGIDLLQEARSAHLALLASIAEEVEADPGAVLIREREQTDALYVVIEGVVDLEGAGGHRLEATEGRAFGTWALIDEAPSLVTATVRGPARLLRITRGDFFDLLADHSELALGLLQGLARRVRTLVA